jgi:superfamily I DNA/RNA helicase
MTLAETIARQSQERQRCLEAILDSKAKRKLVAAGAGTGKTFAFGKLLAKREGENNLALTFIRKLVEDMASAIGQNAEVKTFHAYCKKILHERHGSIELAPLLSTIIRTDAELLGRALSDFDTKIRTLEEDSPELAFYLGRGDYYQVVGFDDSVYRLYCELRENEEVLPNFGQIVVDEYQDFNPLEVAFIQELAKKGDILIVGDDDQALYEDRSASPSYLRQLHGAGEFERFELPFCSRCTEVVVAATNQVIATAQAHGLLNGRIPKRYECYMEEKHQDSAKYPKIIRASCTTLGVVGTYIEREIASIDPVDIAESQAEGKEYPTVLVAGPGHYLREIHKRLAPKYPQISYTPSQAIVIDIVDAYKILITDEQSNFGWRILVDVLCDEETQKRVVIESEDGSPMRALLDANFVATHLEAIQLAYLVKVGERTVAAVQARLNELLEASADAIMSWLTLGDADDQEAVDQGKPTILLTTYKGCKGLSAGHVFIVGAHDGSLPKNRNAMDDREISQFIVALTRTRKQCHVLSNKWFIAPVDGNGKFMAPFKPSPFAEWIPSALVKDLGDLAAKDLK